MILGAHELAKFMGHFTSPKKKMSTKLDAILKNHTLILIYNISIGKYMSMKKHD